MLVAMPVGRDAATKKYDILTALSSFALSQDKHKQRQIMRLMALITARYNWQRDELSMGQKEIARLWSVDTRTVKRELAKLKSLGWLVQKRPGARGRVSLYGLDLNKIVNDTRVCWENVGPDFVERMSGQIVGKETGNVVPFRKDNGVAFDDSFWGRVCELVCAEDNSVYQAWIAPLIFVSVEQGKATLTAPTKFHANYVASHLINRLHSYICRVDPSIRNVSVLTA